MSDGKTRHDSPASGSLLADPGVAPGSASAPAAGTTEATDVSHGFGFTEHLRKYGVLLALLVMFGVFSALRPHTFPNLENIETMLRQVAPLAIAAFGLTVALAMGDFDLSIGAMIGLGGTAAIALAANWEVNYVLAILLTLGIGVLVGLGNGFAVAYAGASSFVITLAMGTILQGIEYQISNQQTIFQNVPHAYTEIGNATLFGVSAQAYVALGVFLILFLVLERSELGRYAYAIGGNIQAARLSGVRVRQMRVLGFVVPAVCAAMAGILLTSQAGQSTPGLGVPYLLPVFAAVFLGSTVFRVGKFNIVGTMIAVLLLEVISTGLIFLELKPALINIIQGLILAGSVLLSRIGKSDARS